MIHELERTFDQITQLSTDTRKVIAGAVREARRLDKLAGCMSYRCKAEKVFAGGRHLSVA